MNLLFEERESILPRKAHSIIEGDFGKSWGKIESDVIFRNLSTYPKWSYI